MYTRPSVADPLHESLLPVVKGLGLDLIEARASRHRGSTQVRVTVQSVGNALPVSIKDCASVHRAIEGRLGLVYGADDLYIEVSSAGIDRKIEDAYEFHHYTGFPVRLYLPEKSDWTAGTIVRVEEDGLVIKTGGKNEDEKILYGEIAKAKLDGDTRRAADLPQPAKKTRGAGGISGD